MTNEATLLTDFQQLLGTVANLIAVQRDRIAALEATEQNAQRQFEILRQLIEIVDPALWKDGQANLHELVEQVRLLKNREEM